MQRKTNSLDLHIHSFYSDDGEFAPGTLVQMCKTAGINEMAITDHNCVKGIDEAQREAVQAGITLRTGGEIDCSYKGLDFHVLGYDFDYQNKAFEIIENNVRAQCQRASKERLQKIRALGFDLEEETLVQMAKTSYWGEQWTGEMFAEALLNDKRYLTHERLTPYRQGGSRGNNPYVNFYWDYFSQGKPCYSPMAYPKIEEVIALIHQSGGKAVLAHPGNNLKGHFGMIDEMISLGLKGIEAFSSYHNQKTAAFFYEKTRQYQLLATGGSDFHGKTKPDISLGEYINF